MFDPRKLIPLSMEDCSAPIAVITEITEKTPIVMPIIVSAARSLFAPRDASAIFTISLNNIGKIRNSNIEIRNKQQKIQISKRHGHSHLRRIAPILPIVRGNVLTNARLCSANTAVRSSKSYGFAFSSLAFTGWFWYFVFGFVSDFDIRISNFLLISECHDRIEAGG